MLEFGVVVVGADAARVRITVGDLGVVDATYGPTTRTWLAAVDVAEDASLGELALTATADLVDGLQIASTVEVPVVAGPVEMMPTVVDAAMTEVVKLAWGDGDGEVGFDDSAELLLPGGFGYLPGRDEFFVLDSVNRRLLRLSGRGELVSTIELPGPGWLDVAVAVHNQFVFVLEYENLGEALSMSGLFVDLDSGIVDRTDPVTIDPIPIGAPLVWNDAEDAIYLYQPGGGGYFRIYDVVTHSLAIELDPQPWIAGFAVPEDSLFGFSYASVPVGIQLPLTNGGGPVTRADDGDVWQLVAGFDPDSHVVNESGDSWPMVRRYLVRTRPRCQAATVTEIPLGPQKGSLQQKFDVDHGTAHVVDVNIDEAFRIHRLELPVPACEPEG